MRTMLVRAIFSYWAFTLCLCAASAQRTENLGPAAPSGPPSLSFEVASVRIDPGPMQVYPFPAWSGRHFTATHVPIWFLIGMAYGNPQNHMLGLPSWQDSIFYDIDAKAGGEGELPTPARQALLQQLLQDRFHLALHHQTKDVPGYALVVAKQGPTLTLSQAPGQNSIYRDKVRLPEITLKSFAGILESVTHEPVMDKTGIQGSYTINLDYAPMDAADSPLPSVFTVLQEQLGLKLVSQKVPVDELVIDHVEKMPTEN